MSQELAADSWKIMGTQRQVPCNNLPARRFQPNIALAFLRLYQSPEREGPMDFEERQRIYNALIGHISGLARTVAGSVTASKLFIIFAAAIGAVMQFWPSAGTPTFSQICGGLAAVLVMLFGIYVLLAERDASSMLADAHKALSAAQESDGMVAALEEELQELDDQLGKSIQLYIAMASARDIYEQAVTAGNFDLDRLLQDLLSTSKRHFAAAMDLTTTDRWTLCIYRSRDGDSGSRELKLVAHVRAIECGLEEARVWPEGVGFAGIALSTGQEIVIDDMTEASVGQIFNVSPGLARPHDSMVYKSAIACPIYVGGDKRPWGVATATNDRAAHFVDDVTPSVHNGEAVRALANMAAMIVTLCNASAKSQ
jgi:F0F1-type ATP synthase assembly protein I